MATQADIVAAIAQLDEDAGGLEKKPKVADVEALIGEDVSGADLTEAWASFKGDESKPEQADDAEGVVVTNNIPSSLKLFDVTIAPGKSALVPKFNPDKPVIAKWLESGAISVE